MVDNVAVTPGAGATIATDDVGGVQYQWVKLDVGGDGASSPVSSTNGVPVSPLVGATLGMSIVSSSAAEASKVIKASAGTLLSLIGYNGRTSQQFIQVFNAAAVPADAAVPIYSFLVYGQSNFSLDVPVSGAPFTTGISVSNSSTQAVKTLGSADCFFTAVIK